MRRTRLILLTVLLTCVLGVQGAWAETKGYIDSVGNPTTGWGVLGAIYTGTSSNHAAVYGTANNWGVGKTYGGSFSTNSTNGAAVMGLAAATSGFPVGGDFRVYSPNGTAVHGLASATSGLTYGGNFEAPGTDGVGVAGKGGYLGGVFSGVHGVQGYGSTMGGDFRATTTGGMAVSAWAQATTGSAWGGFFESASTGGTAVYGRAAATTGYTYGGSFETKSTSGTGVSGNASATSGTNYGGSFRSASTSGRGVYGYASAKSGINYGGYFGTLSTSGIGVRGVASATSGINYGGSFGTASTSGRGVYGYTSAISGTNYGVYGQTSSPAGYGVYSKGNMKVEGNSTVTGTKSAVVKLKNGKGVTLYAVEASENWFEDFGSSKLKEGKAVVEIDPTFVETVNTNVDYHVFLTPLGENMGLYVTSRKGTSFEVREVNGGKSDISFSYRIVAKRKGYEDQRLVQVNEDQAPTMATTELENPQEQKVMEMASQVK